MYTWRQTKSRASWRDAKLTGKLFSTEVETDGHTVFWGFQGRLGFLSPKSDFHAMKIGLSWHETSSFQGILTHLYIRNIMSNKFA